MMKVGMLRTAADLYEGLGLYKEMVECYVAQDESEIAERKVLGLEFRDYCRFCWCLPVLGFRFPVLGFRLRLC